MTWFLGFGIVGTALLAVSLIFDGLLDGLFGGVLDGLLDGLLSLPVIAGFVAMLGFAGAIVLGTTDLGTAGAVAVGVPAGALTGWVAWRFSRALMRDQTTAVPRGEDLVGAAGSVVTAIPAGGYGEVLVRMAGHRVKFSAKSGAPVAQGAEIWVAAMLSPTSVEVRPVER